MRPTYLVPAIVVAALGAIAVPDAVRRAIQSDVSAFARSALVPVPEEQKEPTLAPPEPANEHARRQIVVVRVEGEVPAPGDLLPAMVPTPEPQGEPTPAPPEPPVRLAGASGPQMIVVRVEAEQAIEEGLPTDDGGPDRPGLTGP